jgi:hypothetical protein
MLAIFSFILTILSRKSAWILRQNRPQIKKKKWERERCKRTHNPLVWRRQWESAAHHPHPLLTSRDSILSDDHHVWHLKPSVRSLQQYRPPLPRRSKRAFSFFISETEPSCHSQILFRREKDQDSLAISIRVSHFFLSICNTLLSLLLLLPPVVLLFNWPSQYDFLHQGSLLWETKVPSSFSENPRKWSHRR